MQHTQKILSLLVGYPVLYICNQEGKKEKVTLNKILGSGGLKRAIDIGNGRALIIPNTDVEPIPQIAAYWKRIVDEEIGMTKFVSSIGLLSANLTKVNISISEHPADASIPAYTTDTFESLKKIGVYIIDFTWNQSLFANKEDYFDKTKWDRVIIPLWKDAEKFASYGLPVLGDCLNLAIVKERPIHPMQTEKRYVARYFGFDFSSKYRLTSIPNGNRLKTDPRLVFNSLLKKLLIAEQSHAASIEWNRLQEQLNQRYTPEFIAQILQREEEI